MAISSLVVRSGIGAWGDIAHIITRGLDIGAYVPPASPWTPVTPDTQTWVSASGDTQVWTPANLDSQSWTPQ